MATSGVVFLSDARGLMRATFTHVPRAHLWQGTFLYSSPHPSVVGTQCAVAHLRSNSKLACYLERGRAYYQYVPPFPLLFRTRSPL
jgi:hypothetical protein